MKKRIKNSVNSPETINEATIHYNEVMSSIDYLANSCPECDADYCREQIKDYIKELMVEKEVAYV